MMPEAFRFAEWPLYLRNELVFSCQFFLFATEFKDPFKKRKPVEMPNELPDREPICVDFVPEEWMSQEHYLAAH